MQDHKNKYLCLLRDLALKSVTVPGAQRVVSLVLILIKVQELIPSGKLFETIITDKVKKYLDKHDTIEANQLSFSQGNSVYPTFKSKF